MKSQSEKAQLLRTYHENKETFVIPNPWDIGSARLLALAGFKALATSCTRSISPLNACAPQSKRHARCRFPSR
ncbi:hypothetical protein R69919_00876 [Paraburkholderia gardini]|nr:hypothetical protein R69919_00876 [Paraburkholderia gardini]